MSKLKRATLTDVAKRAGVSVTTASYILNGRTQQMRIADETADRVRRVIDELGYRPNRTAQNLRGSRTHTIGFVSDFVASGAYSSRLITGVNAAARRSSHVALIGETMGDAKVEEQLIEEMLDRGVDGFIYATLAASRVALPDSLHSVRSVTLNCYDPGSGAPAVVPNDVLAGEMSVGQLPDAAIERVYVVGEDPTEGATAGDDRLLGIGRALGSRGASVAGIVSAPWDVEPAYQAVSAF